MKDKILSSNALYAQKTKQLLSELETLPFEQLNRKPADGGWSVMQVLYHLVLVEENSLLYVRKKLSFSPALGTSGLLGWTRDVLLWVSLYSPLKFKAPPSAGSEKIPESGTLPELSARWEQVRNEWQLFLESMPDALADKAVYRHPIAGRLNWLQMLRFFSAHFERHRRQIKRTGGL